jgi:hypothetical protein
MIESILAKCSSFGIVAGRIDEGAGAVQRGGKRSHGRSYVQPGDRDKSSRFDARATLFGHSCFCSKPLVSPYQSSAIELWLMISVALKAIIAAIAKTTATITAFVLI